MTGGLAERLEIALQLARLLVQSHRKAHAHPQLRAASVLIDVTGKVHLRGFEPLDPSRRNADTRAFGFILYELLLGEDCFGGEYPPGIPDLEPLYKAGISAGLVHAVTACTSMESSPKQLVSALNHLEEIRKGTSRERRPSSYIRRVYGLGALAVSLLTLYLMLVR